MEHQDQLNHRFVIFSSGRNCERFARMHFESISFQGYRRWDRITVVDDDPNLHGLVAGDLVGGLRLNYSPLGVLGSMDAHLMVQDDDILVVLDLDDWFLRPDVLTILNQVYQDPNVWVTHGQYITASGKLGHGGSWSHGSSARRIPWWSSYPRTMRGFVYNQIDHEDWKGPDGEWATAACDRGLMYPALDMAGPDRTKFIPTPLAVYNDLNPNNHHKVNPDHQRNMERWFRSAKSYPRLERKS